MAANCGTVEFMEGGIINAATVSNSTIQGSVLNGCTMSACRIESLASIDVASARTIASALAQLSDADLQRLAQALARVLPTGEPGNIPNRTRKDSLPTTVAGGREYLLGNPDGWIQIRGVIVPSYAGGGAVCVS